MRARKVDANHSEIVAAFRKLGFSVLDLSRVGQGCPDILIGKFGRSALAEIKDGAKCKSRTKLTHDECGFHSTWKGRIEVVKSLSDVEQIAENF